MDNETRTLTISLRVTPHEMDMLNFVVANNKMRINKTTYLRTLFLDQVELEYRQLLKAKGVKDGETL